MFRGQIEISLKKCSSQKQVKEITVTGEEDVIKL